MLTLFHTIFYQPIFNLLIYLYNIIPGKDFGASIIILTLIIKLILYPLSRQSIQAQKALQDINPDIEKIKEKYKDEKEKMGPEIMALYKEKKINPFSSCLPVLIQLPVLIAIYQVFFNSFAKADAMKDLYSFVANPGVLNPIAFGFLNLASKSWVIAVLAGLAQFWQSKMLMSKSKSGGTAAMMNQQMLYIMPVITIIIGSRFPAGLALYWLLTTLFTVAQQYLVLGFKKAKYPALPAKN
ncbi:MAG: hypothetical protein C3F02_01780 [Parcubacteria group bacterium]|nr:MAG: hypothetical protein C3F02_01780 [Parcubacteria group bacterium]